MLESAEPGPLGKLFVADSTLDTIVCFTDVDGSGVYDPAVAGEVADFFSGVLPDGNTLSVVSAIWFQVSTNCLVVVDGGTNDAIYQLCDQNGDGDADDPGEVTILRDNNGAGLVTMGTTNGLALLKDGKTWLASDDGSRQRHIFAMVDLDSDGTLQGDGEIFVVFDGDNASGVEITDPESICTTPDDVVFVGDSTLGVVLRLEDLNGDGDYQDPGEAAVFAQFENEVDADSIQFLNGAVYLADENTGAIYRLEDIDADGKAEGAEVTLFLEAGSPASDVNDMIVVGDSFLLADGQQDSVGLAIDADGDGTASQEGEFCWLNANGDSLSTPSAIAYIAPVSDVVEFLRGDANGDGLVEVSDAVSILEFLFLGIAEPACHDAMDADDSSYLNIADSIYLLNYLFLGGTQPPLPFPNVGADPTLDELPCV